MKIELLYTARCPDYARTAEAIRKVLSETRIPASLEMVPVESEEQAQRLRFIGSPTVRVDGLDLDPYITFTATDFGLRCREYQDGQHTRGWPGVRLLRDAIEVGWLAERGLLASCC
ncbi:MAG: hypothetical protein ACE5M4_08445 [Anaerolineales bacterium]